MKEKSKLRQHDIRTGIKQERERIISLAERKICFGHRETGNCEHSVCFGMSELIFAIKGENE